MFRKSGLQMVIIFAVIFASCSLVGDIESLRPKSGENPDSGTPIPNPDPGKALSSPGAPIITASDGILTVRWTAVEGAENYEVYISTTQVPPVAPTKTVSSTTTVLDGLVNKTAYYVWIKAVNQAGSSDFSPRSRGIPWPSNEVPKTPGRPVIIPGINQLTVNWEECGGAVSYEVYISTTTIRPSESRITSNTTSTTIQNLENDIIYYIWVRAINAAGKSDYSPLESGIPQLPTAAPIAPARPLITVGSQEMTVSWQAVELAAAYEVWFGTTDNPSQAQKWGGDIVDLSTVIAGLTNGTTYFVWIKAKNIVGSSGFSPSASAKLIGSMGAVTVNAGDQRLSLSWTAVAGADQYEVYYSTSNTRPDSPAQTVSTTTATISGLTNGTIYYIWVKGKNTNAESNVSVAASGKPLGTPGTPTVISDFRSFTVTWAAVAGADQYEVYYGTGTPTTLATTTTETTATINGLIGGTTYQVRLRAKNTNGVSDHGPIASGVPNNVRSPGLYRGDEKIGDQNLTTALSWISANVVSGDDYYIVLGADESVDPIHLDYSSKTVGITLLGYGHERKITLASNGSMFTIHPSVTLTLDENISLIGRSVNTGPLVHVYNNSTIYNNSTLIMNAGAKIDGNTSSAGGGGISVSTRGTFIMNGGEISGNTASSAASSGGGIYSWGTFTMNGGKISGNTADSGGGISSHGTFTMNGGKISGNTSEYYGGGIYCMGTGTINGGTISGNTVVNSSYNNLMPRYGGGGVCVDNGLFTMHGGIISGNTASGLGGGGGVSVHSVNSIFRKLPPNGDGQNSGIIYGFEITGVDLDGVPLKNTADYGPAIYRHLTPNFLYRNTTAGETDYIDTSTGRGLSANGEPPFGQ